MPEETLGLDRIASLIDHRVEEPDIEYKTWMDLSTPENKSKIAKHLCALTNFGSGWLIFGISDDGSHSEPHPGSLSLYSQDIINGIVARYLHPVFHCNVYFAQSKKKAKKYPIVRVPPHGGQPVSAKADGPLVNKQRVGVTRGIHYTRLPGPRSEPIDSPELWRPILHRCVLAERENLIGSISRLFEQPSLVDNTSSLGEFLDEAIERWNVSQEKGWLVDPVKNRTAFGFELLTSERNEVTPISLAELVNKIREASNASVSETNGLPAFDYYGDLARRSVILVNEIEGYEGKAITDKGTYLFAPSLWRAMRNGVGAEVRPFHEDTDWIQSAVQERSSRRWEPGTRLCPRFQASRIFGWIAFVRSFAKAFGDAQRLRLIVDYVGLAGRRIDDPRAGFYISRDKTSATGQRRFEIEWTVEKLAGDGAFEVAALLLNPILRLFDGWEINAELVRKSLKDY
jgi:hypothetical protein